MNYSSAFPHLRNPPYKSGDIANFPFLTSQIWDTLGISATTSPTKIELEGGGPFSSNHLLRKQHKEITVYNITPLPPQTV